MVGIKNSPYMPKSGCKYGNSPNIKLPAKDIDQAELSFGIKLADKN